MSQDIYKDDQDIDTKELVKPIVLKDSATIQYVIDQIYKEYSAEDGWTCGKPIITPNADGKTVSIKIHLKQDKSKMRGRSM